MKRHHAVVVIGLMLASLGGCQMLDSTLLNTSLDQAPTTCHSNAGTYFLPRKLLNVTVTGDSKTGYGIDVKAGTYVADRNEIYCLDFVLSPSSADRVGIQRNKDGLLERIFTQADDKSKEIAIDAIQGVADLVASDRARSLGRGLPQFKGDAANIVAAFEFDPFVEREAREVNEALRELGYCLYLENRNDPFVPKWSKEICANPYAEALPAKRPKNPPGMVYKADPDYPRSGLKIVDPKPVSPEVQRRGVLYRPELTHALYVRRKPDPGSRFSEWSIVASDRIVMPNAAPAFLLEVERTVFVKAETDVQFYNGMIKSISVDKPSELLAASDLAISAAQIVINIPKHALKIFNNRAENTKELIKVNSELIATLRQHSADVDAQSQAEQGTDLILQRSTGSRTAGRTVITSSTETARLMACLNDPAAQQYPDPVRTCQEIINRGL